MNSIQKRSEPMATWTIQQQEDGIKAAISSAFFLIIAL
jgi:hypothetical protein